MPFLTENGGTGRAVTRFLLGPDFSTQSTLAMVAMEGQMWWILMKGAMCVPPPGLSAVPPPSCVLMLGPCNQLNFPA